MYYFLKRLFCYRKNKHRYILSSNTDNNDVINSDVFYDLTRPNNNFGDYNYDNIDNLKKIVTWNVSELLCFSTPHSRQKIVNYLKFINADCIFLQGVYSSTSRGYIIEELKHIYQFYITGDLYNRYLIGENSGIFVLSKFPIKYNNFTSFENQLNFPDNMCLRGVLYLTINKFNFAITNCPYYKINDVTNCINVIKNQSPFDEYIVCGSLQIPDAQCNFNVKQNNTQSTNKKNTISDYLLSLYNRFHIIAIVKEITDNYVSYNFPVIGFIKEDLIFNNL